MQFYLFNYLNDPLFNVCNLMFKKEVTNHPHSFQLYLSDQYCAPW